MNIYTFGNNYGSYDLREEYNGHYSARELGDISGIIVHHSGFVPDQGSLEAIERTARYHRSRGWPDIGYHFALGVDGESYYVGDILTVRYHATAFGNPWAIGVEVLGDFTSDRPSTIQMAGLTDLLSNLQFALGSMLPVRPHRQVVPTQCPGDGLVAAWQAAQALYGSGVGWV